MPKVLPTDFAERNEIERAVDLVRFGRPAAMVFQGTGAEVRRRYRFLPGTTFCVLWQRWYPGGRQHRAIAFVEALNNSGGGFRLPSISRPVAVHAIVDQIGPAGQGGAVDRTLLLLNSIERAGIELANVPSSYWRSASHQILLQRHPEMPPMPPQKAA